MGTCGKRKLLGFKRKNTERPSVGEEGSYRGKGPLVECAGGSSFKYFSPFKAFLAASLHALWRNKHGIEEHLFQSSHVKHVCTKVCHAISLIGIQPPSGRGTDQKLQENNQISFIHFLRFLPLPQNIALLEFTSDHRAEEGLRLVTFLLSKYKKYKILYTPHCHLKLVFNSCGVQVPDLPNLTISC